MGCAQSELIIHKAHTLFTVPAEPKHIDSLLSDIRQEDRQEWLRWTGVPMRPALNWTIHNCLTFSTLHPDGDCVCIFGAQAQEDHGLLFLAGANRGYEHAADFTYLSRKALDLLHSAHPRLEAFVEVSNERHIKWLHAVGFQFLEQMEAGDGLWPFYRVMKEKH